MASRAWLSLYSSPFLNFWSLLSVSFEIEDFAHSSMTKPNNSAISVGPLNAVGNWISVIGTGIELLEEIINTSEGDNGGPKTQLDANIRSSSL